MCLLGLGVGESGIFQFFFLLNVFPSFPQYVPQAHNFILKTSSISFFIQYCSAIAQLPSIYIYRLSRAEGCVSGQSAEGRMRRHVFILGREVGLGFYVNEELPMFQTYW